MNLNQLYRVQSAMDKKNEPAKIQNGNEVCSGINGGILYCYKTEYDTCYFVRYAGGGHLPSWYMMPFCRKGLFPNRSFALFHFILCMKKRLLVIECLLRKNVYSALWERGKIPV